MAERRTALIRRYLPPQVPDGPRVRLGVAWFGVLCLAMIGGSLAIAVLFGALAALAALQTSAAWRARRVAVNPRVAGVGAALLPLAGWVGNRAIGLVVLTMVTAAAVLGTAMKPSSPLLDRARITANLPVASATLRSGLVVGLAGATVVQVDRHDSLAVIFLAALVSVYETGDHLLGVGQPNRLVGVVAGFLGAAVVTITMTAIYPDTILGDGAVRVVGLLTAIGCPAGQMVGTWILPSTRAKAPAVRRLDSWIVAAPVFLVAITLLR